MQMALVDADLEPSKMSYLNAHATSTPLGDRAEAKAIVETFGEHAKGLWVSSTKSMTGHLLGGAGSLEAGVLVMRCGTRWLRLRRTSWMSIRLVSLGWCGIRACRWRWSMR